MKKILSALLITAVLGGAAYGFTETSYSTNSLIIAQRGCCSHHGGVRECGSNGRIICKDGTYPPSCRC